MTIEEIAYQLNDFAAKGNHAFAKIQEIRSRHGIKPRTWKPFAKFGIKDSYAFHAGGRKEFQFNIGVDGLNDETVFRYGLAFSLVQDKTLHNSKAEFKPKIEGFNRFLSTNPDFFEGYEMWYYYKRHFAEHFDRVRLIDDKIFQADSFIFIGKYFTKKKSEISESDLITILTSFDYLLPLYETVQFGHKEIEKRVARLCWNDNGWVMPSGRYGKSNYEGSHEAKYGYGHEEWLFDTGKLINGYHYGFLEPIRRQQDAYTGNKYDIWLYTIDANTKKRYWIGEIKNAEALDRNAADKIKAKYDKENWLGEMEEQIKASGANAAGFSDWKGVDLFNVRFLPSNIKLNDPYYEIPKSHPIGGLSRYTFAFYNDEFKLAEQEGDGFIFTPSTHEDQDDSRDPKKTTYIREPKTVEIIHLHKAISKCLTEELKKKYGEKNVIPEHLAGYGANKIDIVVNDDSGLIFYEIKTYPALKTSIREAIGQLLEYSLWTNQKKAKQLIVVTQPHSDFEKARTYFKHLRDTFNLPLYYQSYDTETNRLSEII